MNTNRPRVVIVGAGFAGMNAAQSLRDAPVDVLLINQTNYHLFQALLYQVATAGLSPSDIAYPVRAIFRRQKNLRFRLTRMTGLDPQAQVVHTTHGDIPYDYLILALGGETNYFGQESVARHSLTLKDLEDSVTIRNHILKLFESSTQETSPEVSKAMRTIAVVGGGPTGVELAGSISQLIRLVLAQDYPELSFDDVRVLLLEASSRLLPGFPDDLSRKAVEKLQQKHVEVRLNAGVQSYDSRLIILKDGEQIPARTLIWTAGVRAVSLLDQLGFQQARQGRVVVEPTLQVPGFPNIYIAGDAAYLEDRSGNPLPMIATFAIHQGRAAGRNIIRQVRGLPLERFHFEDRDTLATIGRNDAVAQVGGFKFSGFFAWLVWLVIHLFRIIGFRNRLLVLTSWAGNYLFYDRSVRLIAPDTGKAGDKLQSPAEADEAATPL